MYVGCRLKMCQPKRSQDFGVSESCQGYCDHCSPAQNTCLLFVSDTSTQSLKARDHSGESWLTNKNQPDVPISTPDVGADHPQGRLIVNALAALGVRACVRLVWKGSRLFFFRGVSLSKSPNNWINIRSSWSDLATRWIESPFQHGPTA